MKPASARSRAAELLAIAALAAAVIASAAACGGDDDISDIQATATAAAQNATATAAVSTPTPTADATTEYFGNVKSLGQALTEDAGTLMSDMLAASESQADPKWPGVLTADAESVVSAAQRLIDLQPPPGQETLDAQVEAAAQKLIEGANLMKTAVEDQSPESGAQAAAALGEGQGMLQAVLSGLN